jgi:hypothetical protein
MNNSIRVIAYAGDAPSDIEPQHECAVEPGGNEDDGAATTPGKPLEGDERDAALIRCALRLLDAGCYTELRTENRARLLADAGEDTERAVDDWNEGFEQLACEAAEDAGIDWPGAPEEYGPLLDMLAEALADLCEQPSRRVMGEVRDEMWQADLAAALAHLGDAARLLRSIEPVLGAAAEGHGSAPLQWALNNVRAFLTRDLP